MCCQAYVTGERYNIHSIRNYLSKVEKYEITFIPEGKYIMGWCIVNYKITEILRTL